MVGFLDNSRGNCWGNNMDSDSKLDVAGHVLNFGIWIYLLVIAFRINQISFNFVVFPLVGLIGSLIFNLIKLGRKSK